METMDGVGISAAQSFVGVRETPAEYVVFRPKVYIETSIPSYLTSRPSRNPVNARRQRVTNEWWTLHRWQFEVCYSEYVEEEAKKGDPQAAGKRLKKLEPFEKLPKFRPAEEFALRILEACYLSPDEETDARHIALAAMHSWQYLLTWNCKHLANKHLHPKIWHICHKEGYTAPEILTPDEAIRLRIHETPLSPLPSHEIPRR